MGPGGFRHHFLSTQETPRPETDGLQEDIEKLQEKCREGVRNAVDRLNEDIRRRKTNTAA